jgi:hypothetical protein
MAEFTPKRAETVRSANKVIPIYLKEFMNFLYCSLMGKNNYEKTECKLYDVHVRPILYLLRLSCHVITVMLLWNKC